MPKITIQPLELTIEADAGATIMEAAWEQGLYWPTTCGGEGICTSCACSVDEGAENLEPMGRSELRTLTEEIAEATVRSRRLRLACQARVRGDVTVTKQGVRPARPSALTLE
ncbi:MAG TPA: 2Fe-2S iron-sulfur cluster-binding protein [Dehalococcoidia bacterium]|nr:2Fe-2S iron-sulfur cluster-binding protein [Dehalococcoidia bacterium]